VNVSALSKMDILMISPNRGDVTMTDSIESVDTVFDFFLCIRQNLLIATVQTPNLPET